MPVNPTQHIQMRRGDNVRIGPLSLITLIIVLCMAVMGVLSISTSRATAAISERQAAATERMYLDERAGQEFYAAVDDVLADVRSFRSGGSGSASAGVRAVERQLDAICEKARAAADGRVECTASVDGATVSAEFVCEGARLLDVAITIQSDVTCRVDQWKMASTQDGADPMGTLWAG